MAKTLADFVTSVTGHLGNRSGGRIGTQTMEQSITSSIRNGILKILKETPIPRLRRKASTDMIAGTSIYLLPTIDTSGAPITIRSIISVILSVGTERYRLSMIAPQRADSNYLDDTPGTPVEYTVYNSSIELYPIPSAAGTLQYRVNIWPVLPETQNDVSPLGEEWDDVLEEYATYECFAKLQQTLDANLWLTQYKSSLRKTIGFIREDPDDVPSVVNTVLTGSNPLTDPFVMRYN